MSCRRSLGVFWFCLTAILAVSAQNPTPAPGAPLLTLQAPKKCTPVSNCKLVVQVTPVGDKIKFAMEAVANGYVAVALSATSGMMSESSVVECIKANNTVQFHQSFNSGPPVDNKRTNTRLPPMGPNVLLNTTGVIKDGRFFCEFLRPTKFAVHGVNYDLSNVRYFVQAAAGDELKNDTGLAYHEGWVTTLRAVSLVKDEGSFAFVTNINAASSLAFTSSLLLLTVISFISTTFQ